MKLKITHVSIFVGIEPKFDENQAKKIVDLFCSAADANSRFRLSNKGIKISKMREYANSVKNLI